jgi:hypothetical protein
MDIHAGDAHIPAINDFEALLIRVESPGKRPRRITRERTTATNANPLGSKAGTWSIRHRGVKGHSEYRNIKRRRRIFEAADVRKMREGEGACEREIGLCAILLSPCLGRALIPPHGCVAGHRIAKMVLSVRARKKSLPV